MQTAWLESVCCLTLLRLCNVVIVEHHHFIPFISMICGHASTYLCSAAMTSSSWHVYHVTPQNGKSWVATTPYPSQLHEELSTLCLAPKLVTPVEGYPGRVQVIKMECLDPADGWVRLERFIGDWDALHEVAMEALKSLQSCLDGKAVHGDLNPSNLLVRYAMFTSSTFGLSCTAVCAQSTCTAHGVCILHARQLRLKLCVLGSNC